jgi:hypothetical protein
MPSLSYQVDNGPVILPSLLVLDRKMRQLRSAKAAPEADREDAPAAFATDRLDVGGVQQRFECSFRKSAKLTRTYPSGPSKAPKLTSVRSSSEPSHRPPP